MGVTAADIKFYLTGGSGNTDPNASLGGAGSTTEVGSNLFDNITAAEAAGAATADYRAIDVKNNNSTYTLYSAKIWSSVQTAGGAGSDAAYFMYAVDSGTQSVANDTTAPNNPSLTFVQATSESAAISLGDIGPGDLYKKRVWIKRVIPGNGMLSGSDTETITVKGQTPTGA